MNISLHANGMYILCAVATTKGNGYLDLVSMLRLCTMVNTLPPKL